MVRAKVSVTWMKRVPMAIFVIEARSCRAACLLHPFCFLLFQFAAHLESGFLRPSGEPEKKTTVSPVAFATMEGCRSNTPVLLQRFWPAYALR